VLDLVRLAEDRWLARVVVRRRDGSSVILEEILVCRGLPNVEAVIDVREGRSCVVLRARDAPDRVLGARPLDAEPAPLKLIHAAAVPPERPAPARPRPTGPPVPA
jgi:hypothetical protein